MTWLILNLYTPSIVKIHVKTLRPVNRDLNNVMFLDSILCRPTLTVLCSKIISFASSLSQYDTVTKVSATSN